MKPPGIRRRTGPTCAEPSQHQGGNQASRCWARSMPTYRRGLVLVEPGHQAAASSTRRPATAVCCDPLPRRGQSFPPRWPPSVAPARRQPNAPAAATAQRSIWAGTDRRCFTGWGHGNVFGKPYAHRWQQSGSSEVASSAVTWKDLKLPNTKRSFRGWSFHQ